MNTGRNMTAMGSDRYVLDKDNIPRPEPDLIRWATSFGSHRTVKQEYVGRSFLSTVFLGLDHNYNRGGPPILWETMAFGGKLGSGYDQLQDRCSGGWEQAEAMHEHAKWLVEDAEGFWVDEEFSAIYRWLTENKLTVWIRRLVSKFTFWKLRRSINKLQNK